MYRPLVASVVSVPIVGEPGLDLEPLSRKTEIERSRSEWAICSGWPLDVEDGSRHDAETPISLIESRFQPISDPSQML